MFLCIKLLNVVVNVKDFNIVSLDSYTGKSTENGFKILIYAALNDAILIIFQI